MKTPPRLSGIGRGGQIVASEKIKRVAGKKRDKGLAGAVMKNGPPVMPVWPENREALAGKTEPTHWENSWLKEPKYTGRPNVVVYFLIFSG